MAGAWNGRKKEQGARGRHARGEGAAVREAHENRFFRFLRVWKNFLVERLRGGTYSRWGETVNKKKAEIVC